MKFRDPKTGEVLCIKTAVKLFCTGNRCGNCALSDTVSNNTRCDNWAEAHPTEAARLMGYEVVEEKEEPMEKTDKPHTCKNCGNNETKTGCGICTCSNDDPNNPSGWTPVRPRICEVLGVEVGERFKVKDFSPDYYVDEAGRMLFDYEYAGAPALLRAINHPEDILRKPRFSSGEIAILREWAKAYPGARLVRKNSGRLSLRTQTQPAGELANWLFSGLRPGQAVRLEEVK